MFLALALRLLVDSYQMQVQHPGSITDIICYIYIIYTTSFEIPRNRPHLAMKLSVHFPIIIEPLKMYLYIKNGFTSLTDNANLNASPLWRCTKAKLQKWCLGPASYGPNCI